MRRFSPFRRKDVLMAIILYNNFWGEWGGERGWSKNRQKPPFRVSLGGGHCLGCNHLFLAPHPPRRPTREVFGLHLFSQNLKVCLEGKKEVFASCLETDSVLRPTFLPRNGSSNKTKARLFC